MPGPDAKISILLNGGVDNRSLSEFIAPIVTQGQGPKLVESTNTRLSKTPGTCARAPKATTVAQDTAGRKRWGLIPSKAGRNTISCGGIATASYVFPDEGLGSGATGAGNAYVLQEPFVPSRITAAGSMDAVGAVIAPAMGYNSTTGVVWRAYLTDNGTQFDPYVSAWSLDGVSYAIPRAMNALYAKTSIAWLGITTHGASGTRLWYSSPSGICYRSLSLSGRTITIGSQVIVVVPGAVGTGMDVVSDGAGYAYLAHSQNGSATGATLRRVDINTGSTTHSVNIANGLQGGGHCSVHYGTVNSATRVGVAFSRVTGATTKVGLYDSTLTAVGAPLDVVTALGGSAYGRVDLKFYDYGSHFVAVAVSKEDSDFSTAAAALRTGSAYTAATSWIGTIFFFVDVTTWVNPAVVNFVPWMVLQVRGAQWTSGSYQVPIFFLGKSYGNTKYGFGEDNYVDDGSIEAYSWLYLGDPATGVITPPIPFARFGCVRGISLPAKTFPDPTLVSSSVFAVGDEFFCSYAKLPLNATAPLRMASSWVKLDMSAHQPPVAHDKDGAALVAGALPFQFDGSRLVEVCGPLHAPRISLDTTVGPVLAAGVYRFAVRYIWRDAAGAEHRSRPSNILTITMDGATDQVSVVVSRPDGLITWPYTLFFQAYMSEVNGTTLKLFAESALTLNEIISGNGCVTFTPLAAVAAYAPNIYTTAGAGEELPPQPPPPLRDISIIGARAWGIDAEFPDRCVYSKLRVAGVGYEFFPAGEVILPSSAGEAYAIRAWQGMPVILCEHGVYQVSGEGPNNMGVGSFSSPVKVSDIGCTNTASALEFPGGIIWQSGMRFAILSGAGLDYVPDFNCEYDVSHAVLSRRYDEILFFSNETAGARVYNYGLKKWTTWDDEAIPDAVTSAALLPWDTDMILLQSESSGTFRRLDADSTSTCTSMTWLTDRMLLGGDFQEHVIFRDVVFSANIGGPHSITIEMYVDDETTASTIRTWTSTQLSAAATAQGDGTRYTVRFEPQKQSGRSVRFKVYDTVEVAEVNRAGVQPKALTLIYASNGQLYQEVFNSDSRQ